MSGTGFSNFTMCILTTLVELHDAAAGVVLAVPNDLIRSSLVQDPHPGKGS